MPYSWLRNGDYYQELKNDNDKPEYFYPCDCGACQFERVPLKHLAYFYSTDLRYSNTIREIVFWKNQHNTIGLGIGLSLVNGAQILKIASDYPFLWVHEDRYQIEINLSDNRVIPHLFKFLYKINRECNIHLPPELFAEIRLMFDAASGTNALRAKGMHRHILPDVKALKKYTTTQPNPVYDNSLDLINLLKQLSHLLYYEKTLTNSKRLEKCKKVFRAIAQLLINGKDPNWVWRWREGITPLTFIDDTYTLKYVMTYQGNVFARNPGRICGESTFERYLRQKNYPCLATIQAEMTKPNHSVNPEHHHQVLKPPVAELKDDELRSRFVFAKDNIITTRRIKIGTLTQKEKDQIYAELFSKKFISENLKNIFDKEFSAADDTYIELVYQQIDPAQPPALIGYHSYSLLKAEDHLVYYAQYGQIEPLKKINNLMAFILFKTAFAIQRLVPNEKLVIFFEPITAISYDMLPLCKKMLHSPKYQPPIEQSDHLIKIMDAILRQAYPDEDIQKIHNLTQWCIREKFPFKVRGYDPKQFSSEFFEMHIRKGDATLSPLVLLYVTMQSLQIMADLSASLGINFKSHIDEQAKLLWPSLNSFLTKNGFKVEPNFGQSLNFADAPQLLFNGIRRPANDPLPLEFSLLKSGL